MSFVKDFLLVTLIVAVTIVAYFPLLIWFGTSAVIRFFSGRPK